MNASNSAAWTESGLETEAFQVALEFPPQDVQELGSALAASRLRGVPLGLLEQAAILATLDDCSGNRTHAAQRLGISVRTLQRKLKAWRIQPS
jgi:DNA-binding NtrC family response regulator